LVEPDDVQAIRNAIVMLQSNPDLRRRLADAAFSRAARFDLQARARRILEWMEEKIRVSRSDAPAVVNLALCDRLAPNPAPQIDRVDGLSRNPQSGANRTP
jgi:hypothetical protein